MYRIDYIKCMYGEKCIQMHKFMHDACVGEAVFFNGKLRIIFTDILSHVWAQTELGVRNYGRYSIPLGQQMSQWNTLWGAHPLFLFLYVTDLAAESSLSLQGSQYFVDFSIPE